MPAFTIIMVSVVSAILVAAIMAAVASVFSTRASAAMTVSATRTVVFFFPGIGNFFFFRRLVDSAIAEWDHIGVFRCFGWYGETEGNSHSFFLGFFDAL